jgi:glycerol-3-phosphate responsive antiterminator
MNSTIKTSEKNWDMEKILAECCQMASVLTKHVAELRDWKKRSFKSGMKDKAETLKEAGDFHQLMNWMKDMANRK